MLGKLHEQRGPTYSRSSLCSPCLPQEHLSALLQTPYLLNNVVACLHQTMEPLKIRALELLTVLPSSARRWSLYRALR
jgi:hypothetical protein